MSAESLPTGINGAILDNRRGILLSLAAFAVFSGTDTVVKLCAQGLPAPQVTLFVTIAAFVLLCIHVAFTGNLLNLVPRKPGIAILRALLLAGDTLLIHYAFALLPLSEAYLIAFMTPILVAVMSLMLLRERLSPTGWAGVFLGFAGVTIALRPDAAALGLGHAAALGSTVLFALSLVILRKITIEERDEALLASLFAVLIPLAWSAAWFESGRLFPVSAIDSVMMAAGGMLLLFGHGLLIRAFRISEASIVAPFQYSQIIWGCLYGVVFFAAPIEVNTLVGAAIIIVSGWLVLRKA